VLASVSLLGRYAVRKMLDRDPWAETVQLPDPIGFPWIAKLGRNIANWWNSRKRQPGS